MAVTFNNHQEAYNYLVSKGKTLERIREDAHLVVDRWGDVVLIHDGREIVRYRSEEGSFRLTNNGHDTARIRALLEAFSPENVDFKHEHGTTFIKIDEGEWEPFSGVIDTVAAN